jgi:hypothetical protein
VAGLCAIRPDALVRLSPLRHRGVDLAAGDRPDRARQSPSGKRRNRRRIDEGRSHVVLCVAHSRVADAYRPRAAVPHQVGELGLVRRVVAIQAVQVLERPFAMGHVRQEREKVVRLPAEAERVQRPKRPRRVAHERIAKVPVPHAARDAREGRRRSSRHRARRRVGQRLQRQRATVQVRPPRMVGKTAVRDPAAPVLRRSLHAGERLVDCLRRLDVGPRERYERALRLAQRRPCRRAATFET